MSQQVYKCSEDETAEISQVDIHTIHFSCILNDCISVSKFQRYNLLMYLG